MEQEVIELAWAAGFFDGEGCTSLRRHGANAAAACAIGQKHPEVLHRFHMAVGVGAIYHLTSHRTEWRWQTTNEPDARQVIELLRPYLGTLKRDQADAAFAASTWHDGHKDQLTCRDPTHEIVPRAGGGRRCKTCRSAYNRDYKTNRAIRR